MCALCEPIANPTYSVPWICTQQQFALGQSSRRLGQGYLALGEAAGLKEGSAFGFEDGSGLSALRFIAFFSGKMLQARRIQQALFRSREPTFTTPTQAAPGQKGISSSVISVPANSSCCTGAR
jgi:hypothetical protein